MTPYATVDDANEYFSYRIGTDVWDDATPTLKERALAHGTQLIDRLKYRGSKTSEQQFPRNNETTIPTNVVNACCEIALALLDQRRPGEDFEQLWITNQGYGSSRTTYNTSNAPEHILHGIPSYDAWVFLRPLIRFEHNLRVNRV